MKGTTLIDLTDNEFKALIDLLGELIGNSMNSEEELKLYEKLKGMEASNAGN
ncbi:hypothetical protein [Providencia rustigianii]|uniref:hypothetical protein n=1 Tax=Providencia rustigianii TaxID=158850 RepID=UPI00223F5F1A|nr:hypothetical protein [Providencia rustigianii]